jgi:opacity protein-like surface antigen
MSASRKAVYAALLTASLGVGAAFAQSSDGESRLYAGATFGQAHWRPGCASASACDDTNSALRVLAGYQINRLFAAEVGFHNLGKADAPGAGIKANAWEALLVAGWPLASALSIYGKAGVYRGNAEGSGALTAKKETNYNGTFGFGVQYEVSHNIALRGEWQAYSRLAGGTLGPRSDVDVVSAGALWRFR